MLQTTEVMIWNQASVPGLHLRIEKERMMKLRINEVDPKIYRKATGLWPQANKIAPYTCKPALKEKQTEGHDLKL